MAEYPETGVYIEEIGRGPRAIEGVPTSTAAMLGATERGPIHPRCAGISSVIRSFAGRGIRVWGARTLASDALWKYVNVRRLFIYLEHSIYQGTQWVVFA